MGSFILRVAGLLMLAGVVGLTQGGWTRIRAPATALLDDHGRYVPTAPLEASLVLRVTSRSGVSLRAPAVDGVAAGEASQ